MLGYKNFFGGEVRYDTKLECFVSEIPESFCFSKYYEEEYVKSGFYAEESKLNKNISWVPASDFYHFKSYLKSHSKVLEIGSNNGGMLNLLESFGYDFEAIELDKKKWRVLDARYNICNVERRVYNESIDYLIDKGKKYDLIYMRHVLEHVVDPFLFLEKIKKLLRNRGIVYINVPCCESSSYLKKSIVKNPHIYHFTSASLSKIAVSLGYNILSLFTCNWKKKSFPVPSEFGLDHSNFSLEISDKSEFIVAVIKFEV